MFTHTTNRNWNKNRRDVSPSCIGVDLNRNFQYQFLGWSDVRLWITFGTWNFSLWENFFKALQRKLSGAIFPLRSRNSSSAWYFDQISRSSQNVFESASIRPANHYSLQLHCCRNTKPGGSLKLGNQAAAAIRAAPSQRSYAVGVGGVLSGVESGTSLDFAYETRRIALSFTLRLPRGGSTGWDVPQSQLPAIVAETFRGFLVFARHVATS